MRTDGWITIGTKIDNSKFDRDLEKLNAKIDNEEKRKQIKYDAKLTSEKDLESLQQEILSVESEFEKVSEKAERFNQLIEKSNKTKLSYTEVAQLQELEEANSKFEVLGAKLDQLYAKQDKVKMKVQQTNLAYDEAVRKVDDLKSRANEIDLKRANSDLKNMKNTAASVGKNFESLGKTVMRTTLAIFGIRTALSVLSRASSQLQSYDKQYATDIKYIQFALTQLIAPVLKYIVSLFATILQYINYIAQMWFKINLFSKAGAKDFKAMAGSAASIKKSLQTTPFDEMNILSDNSTSGGGGAGEVPSFDLGSLEDVEIPSWLQWIVDHKEEVIAGILGIVGALVALKLGLDPLKAMGIGIALVGIASSIADIKDYIDDPSWENFGKVVKSIGIAVLGLGIIIGSLPVAIGGAIAIIAGLLIQNWENIKKSFNDAMNWLVSKMDWVREQFGLVGETIYKLILEKFQYSFNVLENFLTAAKGIFDGLIKFITGVFEGDWGKAWEGIKDIFFAVWNGITNFLVLTLEHYKNKIKIAVSAIGEIINGVVGIIKGLINIVIGAINNVIRGINRMQIKIPDWSPINPGATLGFNIPQIPRLKVGAIINQPGRGVPVGGGTAIGGEAGREGIIPLTDENAMQILGENIGRYVTINANITNSMNGRVIARILQQIQNDRDFAFNS